MAAPDWLAEAKALIAQGKGHKLQLLHTKALLGQKLDVGLLQQASKAIAAGHVVTGKAAHALKKAGIAPPAPAAPISSKKLQPAPPPAAPQPVAPVLVPGPAPQHILEAPKQEPVATFPAPVPGTGGFDFGKLQDLAGQLIESKLGSLLGPAQEKLNGQAAAAGVTQGQAGAGELEPLRAAGMPGWVIPAAIAGIVLVVLIARR